ncbi:prolyl-tRNA synthetase [Bdellovibrio bacteriovorus W]|nr:prolyl-tRNA synthetase [Bdellovibrio bacteriovorus W]
MGAHFLDAQGKAKPFEMGCYGIGVTRTVQAAIEQSHDKDGIIWPLEIAPFKVHMCVLDPADAELMKVAEQFYADFNAQGVDVFMDDRDERPGVKFKDADLLGMPVRVVIGKRGLQNNEIEVVDRKSKEVSKVAPNAVMETVQGLLKARS